MSWRDFSDDAQRLAFWLTLVAGAGAAISAGAYWNLWSAAWNLPPPIRGLVVLGAALGVFVLWYAVAFTGYRYFGFPKTNPFVRPRVLEQPSTKGDAEKQALAREVPPPAAAPLDLRPQTRTPVSVQPTLQTASLADAERAYEKEQQRRMLLEAARLDLSESEVALELKRTPGGLLVQATNLTANTIRDFLLTLIDMRWWSELAQTFVETPALHGQGHFPVMELTGDNALFHGKPARFTFLSPDVHAPVLRARPLDPLKPKIEPLRDSGNWRATFALRAGDRSRVQHLTFVWQAGHEALPTDFRPHKEAVSAPRPEQIRLLIELAEFAVHRLLNDPQNDSSSNLKKRVEAWESQVLSALDTAGATQSDRSWFRVLSTYTPKGLTGKTPEHMKIRNEIAEKIDRLREITSRLEKRVSK